MTAPIVEYVAQGGQTDFDVPFPFLHRTHVEVRANGIRLYPTQWVSPTRLRLGSPPGHGSLVTISRNTPITELMVKFTNGAVLTESDLNTAMKQLLFKQQELTALYEGTLHAARVRIGEAGGVAVTPEDAANQIAALVAQDQVLAEFRARISDVNLNAETILSRSLQDQENRERVLADIRTERLTRISEDEALASRIDIVEAGYEDNLAAILQEATARATADEAMAQVISLIGAKNADGSAFILNDEMVKLADGTALGARLSGIDAILADHSATIVSEQQARADGDQALASSLETVSTTVGNHTASISTLQQSVNGLATRWGIQLNTNGYISGVVMNNSGGSSDFTVLADKFRVINNANGSYIQPFIVEGGVVKIQALLAGTINADLITAGKLNVDNLIWDGALKTVKLIENAVTVGAFAQAVSFGATSLSVAISKDSAQSVVEIRGAISATAGGHYSRTIRLFRGDTLLLERAVSGSVGPEETGTAHIPLDFMDVSAPAGTHVYRVEAIAWGMDAGSNICVRDYKR